MGFSVYSGAWKNPGGKEEDKARQAVCLTPLNPFGRDIEEEKPHSQDAVYWVRLKEAQDKDCNSGKRNHLQS